MKILFIGYWGFHEGLTQATILPHLKTLSDIDRTEKIVFTTIERKQVLQSFKIDIPKVIHQPIYSRNLPLNLLNKFYDFIYIPKILLTLIRKHQIDKIICRGAPAGSIGYLIWKKTKIPYYVESFEPHSDYMLESKVWQKFDPRFLVQKYWERQQKRTASGLMPVAESYKHQLIKEGIGPKKIVTVPCSANLSDFKFNPSHRERIRKRLNIDENRVVGIYVGKFGGIYYDKEAFLLFREAFFYFKEFFLIILSPDEKSRIEQSLHEYGIIKQFILTSVKHNEVSEWLSAADIAFSLYKPSLSKRSLSPIKHGEYWANGLPILIFDGIGDDSSIIKKEGGGSILRWNNCEASFREIENIIADPMHRSNIPNLVEKYRNPDLAVKAYTYFLTLNTCHKIPS